MSYEHLTHYWATQKRELLEAIKRNQPAPYGRLIAAVAFRKGLKRRTVAEWVNELIEAGLARFDPQNRLQLEETAEALLGYK